MLINQFERIRLAGSGIWNVKQVGTVLIEALSQVRRVALMELGKEKERATALERELSQMTHESALVR